MANLSPAIPAFIFQPGGTNRRLSEGVPIYTDWARLYADLSASTAPSKVVLVDDTFTAVPTIPAGIYDFTGTRLQGRWSLRALLGTERLGLVELNFITGARIDNCPIIEGIYLPLPNSIATPFRWNTDGAVWLIRAFVYSVSGSNPLMEVVGGSDVYFHLTEESILGGFSTTVMELFGSSTVKFRAINNSSLSDDALKGAVTETVGGFRADIGSNMNLTQPLFLGTIPSSSNDQSASSLKYTPTTTGDWSGADPTTVQQALDRIASVLGPV
jgi:hypothetical protein